MQPKVNITWCGMTPPPSDRSGVEQWGSPQPQGLPHFPVLGGWPEFVWDQKAGCGSTWTSPLQGPCATAWGWKQKGNFHPPRQSWERSRSWGNSSLALWCCWWWKRGAFKNPPILHVQLLRRVGFLRVSAIFFRFSWASYGCLLCHSIQ